MTLRTLVLLSFLFRPVSASALSCGIHVEVVNHRPHTVTVLLKSFHSDRAVPAPSAEDFDVPVYGGAEPAYLSSLERIEIPVGDTAEVRFRRLCSGDFWLNWKVVPSAAHSDSSGQLRPYDREPIHIR